MNAEELETALWVLGRGTGIVALVLLTVSVVLGITVRSRKVLGPVPRFGVTDLHRTAGLTASGLVTTHVLTLLLDPQAGLRLLDLVVPFVGGYRPFWLGLGTLALELVLLVAVTGLLRKRIGERAFRAAHLTSYALWPIALGHSLGTGTDAGTLWMDGLAVCCAVAVLAAGWWRIGPDFGKPSRASAPARLQHPEALGAADLDGRVPLVGEPRRQ
ncbi:sulfoxide reductase heme-binding subunit YedZ [Marmoricola sp. OAE513]|uniref:ferric reductase-like transmembrane domain-containing protein n=1 Tax=Marmoricola sp. OAE513 TaxID=2817894 RepID=UPI001AE2922F